MKKGVKNGERKSERRKKRVILGSQYIHLSESSPCPAKQCCRICCPSVVLERAHTRWLDTTLNDPLRIISGCLRPTPSEFFPVLACTALVILHREHLTHSLVSKASLVPRHPLHNHSHITNSLRQQLPSRSPFSRLCNCNFNMPEEWRSGWQETHYPRHPIHNPPKYTFVAWSRTNPQRMC